MILEFIIQIAINVVCNVNLKYWNVTTLLWTYFTRLKLYYGFYRKSQLKEL